MYLKKVALTNIRSIDALEWELPASAPTLAGWHVIIGDNGAGKSSVLRAIALALVGPYEAIALRQDWNEWLRWGEQSGSIHLTLDWDEAWDSFTGEGRKLRNVDLQAELRLERSTTNLSQAQLSLSLSSDS